MVTAAPPLEWVPGKSRLGWYAGFFAAFLGCSVAADVALRAGLLWSGVSSDSANLSFVLELAGIGMAAGPGVLWFLLLPPPASGLWVSPRGLILDYGLRTPLYPWDHVVVRGTRLEASSRRFGIRAVYSLTPYQVARIESVRAFG